MSLVLLLLDPDINLTAIKLEMFRFLETSLLVLVWLDIDFSAPFWSRTETLHLCQGEQNCNASSSSRHFMWRNMWWKIEPIYFFCLKKIAIIFFFYFFQLSIVWEIAGSLPLYYRKQFFTLFVIVIFMFFANTNNLEAGWYQKEIYIIKTIYLCMAWMVLEKKFC